MLVLNLATSWKLFIFLFCGFFKVFWVRSCLLVLFDFCPEDWTQSLELARQCFTTKPPPLPLSPVNGDNFMALFPIRTPFISFSCQLYSLKFSVQPWPEMTSVDIRALLLISRWKHLASLTDHPYYGLSEPPFIRLKKTFSIPNFLSNGIYQKFAYVVVGLSFILLIMCEGIQLDWQRLK